MTMVVARQARENLCQAAVTVPSRQPRSLRGKQESGRAVCCASRRPTNVPCRAPRASAGRCGVALSRPIDDGHGGGDERAVCPGGGRRRRGEPRSGEAAHVTPLQGRRPAASVDGRRERVPSPGSPASGGRVATRLELLAQVSGGGSGRWSS